MAQRTATIRDSQLYWGSIEYSYTKKHKQYAKLKGGLVYAFFVAQDVREFLAAVEAELGKLHIEIDAVEFVSLYDVDMEWEDEDDNDTYKQLAEKAVQSSEVVFDDFYAYER
ncbi:hypothetical protein [Polluticoccus soli]|uniref:hypothetical protein n=1 Tax=Polluticoccus soli TaxID=3034150 RepID=UPI0023E10A66|nr:hypothetical protein [Flavipsychrobacter sp. JY13-12]